MKRQFLQGLLKRAAGALVLLALPAVVSNDYYLHLVNLTLVYALLTIGLNVISGYAGQISLGQAAFLGVGAYVSAYMTTKADFSFWIALPTAVLISVLLGLAVAFFTLHLQGPYLAMATIGVGEIIHRILVNWVGFSGGPSGMLGIPSIHIGALSVNNEVRFYYLILVVVVIVYAVLRRLMHARPGLSLVAIREHEAAGKSIGLNTTALKVAAFGVSTGLAGMAGAFQAHWVNYINPDGYTFDQSLLFLTMILFGGMGNITGSLVGTGLLVFLSEGLRSVEQYRLIVYAVLIIVVITVMPKGVVGLWDAFLHQLRKGLKVRKQPHPKDQEVGHKNGTWRGVRSGRQESDEIILAAENITKNFGGLKALDNIGLEVRKGTIHALIGPNGSGKTTFLNILAGWYRPDQGRVRLGDRDITVLPMYRRTHIGIARTFQNILLFRSMTVLENILVATPKNMAKSDAVNLAYQVLEFVNLRGMAHVPASSLPYGQRRKVEIARALVLDPVILLLDEPAAGMNGPETEELMKLLVKIRSLGVTILVVEHDMKLIMRLADRVTVLDQGKKLAEGPPVEISRHPQVIEAYLGRRGAIATGE